MKKIMLPTFLSLAILTMAACGKGNSEKEVVDQSTDTSTLETQIVQSDEMIFTAKVVSTTVLESADPALQILLEDPVAVEDSEKMLPSFQNGVALNVPPELMDFDAKALVAGTQVKVTLKQPAAITMSLPPQVPGNSILAVELVK